MAKKAIGRVGSWFAHVEGVELPCAHKYWLKKYDYHDPYLTTDWSEKNDEFAAAVMQIRRVILTNSEARPKDDGGIDLRRTGYIAVYEVDNVLYSKEGLKFRLIKKIEELL